MSVSVPRLTAGCTAARRQSVLLWAYAGALALAAAAVFTGPVQQLSAPPRPFEVPWLLLVAGFLLAEVGVVHYDFRSETHSFSLSELPLVFGLLFAEPSHVVAAQVVGAGAALVVHRRQTGVKLLFNVANLALVAGVSVLVFQAVLDPAQVLGPEGWLAALLAAVTGSTLSALTIVAAIALSEGTADLRRLPEQLALAMLATVGGGSLGLLGAEASAQHSAAVVLLGVPVTTFLLAYRTYVRQRQEHDSLQFLYESARILDTAPDLASAMSSLLRSACRTFRAQTAQFVLSDADGSALLISTTADEVRSSGQVAVASVDALLQRGMRLDQPQMLTLDPPLPGPDGHALQEVMVGSVGGNTRTPGALLLGNKLGTGTFTTAQLHLFRTVIAQTDVSLENGRLASMLGEATSHAERERANSLELQRGLLPSRLPERADVDVAVRYQPSGYGAEVGGDWYDVLALPSGALGVVIGDVLGHDLRSAARMAQARSALRAYATEGHDPATVMDRLNRLLAETDPDFMGTCCYAEVRPEQGTVTFVLAGHPPPLLVPTTAPAGLVEAEPGLPLGVDEQAEYAATTVPLLPGTALVLYTDGLVESRTGSLSQGLDRITRTPGVTAAAGVEQIADLLLSSMPDAEAGDDVALLVLRPVRDAARVVPAAPRQRSWLVTDGGRPAR